MKKYILVLFIAGFLSIPGFSFAQVIDEDPNPTTSDCVSITNNLRYRDRDANKNGEVSTLQDFLQSKGYLNSEPTGYLGLLTFKAVKDFQKDNGISPTGYLGSITRTKIANLTGCTGPIPVPPPTTSSGTVNISGVSGPQSLSVGQTGTWTVKASDSRERSLSYSVVWGDEGYLMSTTTNKSSSTQQTATFTHTYLQAGVYTPIFFVANSSGQTARASLSVSVGKIETVNSRPLLNLISVPSSVTVGQLVNFTFSAIDANNDDLSWSIDWGEKTSAGAVCITPNPQQKRNWTYNTSHAWGAAGTYTVKVTVSDCVGGIDENSFKIVVVGTSTVPVISGVSGPQSLNINQTGTWTVTASDPSGENLTYSVDWGDSGVFCTSSTPCPTSSQVSQQSATFTHSYTSAGTYTPMFIVTNSKGGKARTSLSVNVLGITTPIIGTKLNIAVKSDSPQGVFTGGTNKYLFGLTASVENNLINPVTNIATITSIDVMSNYSSASVSNLKVYPVEYNANLNYASTCAAISVSSASTVWRCTLITTGSTNQVDENTSRSYMFRGDLAYFGVGSVNFSVSPNNVAWRDETGATWNNQPSSTLQGGLLTSPVSTTPTVPSAPTNLTATVISGTQINLSWSPVTGATSYTVTYSAGSFSTTGTTYSMTNLSCNTGYGIGVRAVNSAGSSAEANITKTTAACSTSVLQTGDVDGNGFVTCDDYNTILNSVSGAIPALIGDQKTRADVSKNGTVSSYDAALLLQSPYNLSCGTASVPGPALTANVLGALDNTNASSCVIASILSKGMNSEEVRCLQQKLIKKSFEIEGISSGGETTYFGYNTLMALKAFQSGNGLVADGIFGPASNEVLGK